MLSWKLGGSVCLTTGDPMEMSLVYIYVYVNIEYIESCTCNVSCQWGLPETASFLLKPCFCRGTETLFFLFHLDPACQLRDGNVFLLLRGSLNAYCLFVSLGPAEMPLKGSFQRVEMVCSQVIELDSALEALHGLSSNYSYPQRDTQSLTHTPSSKSYEVFLTVNIEIST